ncbi:hypothetical protein P8631_08335 [Guyparkeria sp. 1SP6A2]|nr:hypothetical protein [Guyparkeria sp. 1SP6A2]
MLTHLAGKAVEGGGRLAAPHATQDDITGLAFDQRADGRAVAGAPDEAALPVTGSKLLLDVFRAVSDAQLVGHHRAAGKRSAAARPSRAALLAQCLDHLTAQRALWMGIDRGVDGFVTDLFFGVFGMHAPESAGYLLGRPAAVEQTCLIVS